MKNLKTLSLLVGVAVFMTWINVYGLSDDADTRGAVAVSVVLGLVWGLWLFRFRDKD